MRIDNFFYRIIKIIFIKNEYINCNYTILFYYTILHKTNDITLIT